MSRIEIDFVNIACGLFVSFVGLIAVVISLFRLKSKDFTLSHFGLFCSVYGIRWLVETPTMVTLVGFPFTFPYFHALLTYIVPIPFSAFLVKIFGRGLYDSMIWFFRSTIIYAIAAIAYDLFRTETLAGTSINPIVVVAWCLVGIVNLVFVKGLPRNELLVLRSVFFFLFFCIANDNLVSLQLVPWRMRLEHVDIIVLCIGLGYVAVQRFFSTEKKLFAIEQELTIARRIQRSNLPDTYPTPAGLNIVARYVPMTAVAGDFYDIQTNGKTGLGILIADVSGHGVGAALVGSMLKIAFTSQSQHLDDPARVLMDISRILHDKIENSFVTACALYIDVEQGAFQYANAGHPPPMLWRESKREMLRLSHAGTILGPFPNSVYENEELRLAKGDRLILYTDGLVETKSKSGEFFGDHRLEALLEAHSSDSADVTADRIVEDLFKWSGGSRDSSLDDDLTLIIVDVLCEPSTPNVLAGGRSNEQA
jgi:sigma-B regulation protein RsbU (phosphoserine phosphatase)